MNNLDKQTRKNVLISGASSGIGAATAKRFASEGWNVCVNARRENLLVELFSSILDHVFGTLYEIRSVRGPHW